MTAAYGTRVVLVVVSVAQLALASGDYVKKMTDALGAGPALFGDTEKNGMLPESLWHQTFDALENRTAVLDWALRYVLGDPGGGNPQLEESAPPKSDVCTLLWNPSYRWVFIKNTKVAGTSIWTTLGPGCGRNATLADAKERPKCIWFTPEILRAGPEAFGYPTMQAMWRDFFVFASVRNPYTRAASSYEYIYGLHPAGRGPRCRPIPFKHFARRPYSIGLQNLAFNCGDAMHDFYHVEPQFDCLLDADGGYVVDYILRQENLHEDFEGLLERINARRGDLPPLVGEVGHAQLGPLGKGSTAAPVGRKARARRRMGEGMPHWAKFQDCGWECVESVNSYYKQDFHLLNYPMLEA